MDQRPDDVEAAIERTRARLDRDLTRLGRRVDAIRNNAAARAQWWGGIAAIAAGVVGTLLFWPRHAPART
ncbi:MAG: hypothetical protein DMG01_14725 [Acidobacteria bacterium]|nr:MAG: hypothetical protein DMG01_14725 [Acidobacteriota bacterium]PYR03124.1 MAG: hypothetical protein DMG00_27250 [Acidobacteriota bacterium]